MLKLRAASKTNQLSTNRSTSIEFTNLVVTWAFFTITETQNITPGNKEIRLGLVDGIPLSGNSANVMQAA
jgi:hypothetical protein